MIHQLRRQPLSDRDDVEIAVALAKLIHDELERALQEPSFSPRVLPFDPSEDGVRHIIDVSLAQAIGGGSSGQE